jgi:citrate synthase
VYRSEDPRVVIIREALDRYIELDGYEDALDGVAKELAAAVLVHPYFVERRIFPNVDLYVGSCLRALGVPDDLNTTVMALGRMVGWLAHWHEATAHNSPIVRPRDLYGAPQHAGPPT